MSESVKQRYSWRPTAGAGYTNSTDLFEVIVGLDAEAAFTTAGDVLFVQASGGGPILDSIEMEAFGVAASEILIALPHKILVPPGATVTSPHSASLSVVTCYNFGGSTSLENALAIL